MKVSGILALVFMVCLLASEAIFVLGQNSIRQATVVRIGVPFYRGVHYGVCAQINESDLSAGQACATEQK